MHFHERRTLIQALCFSLAVHAVLLTGVVITYQPQAGVPAAAMNVVIQPKDSRPPISAAERAPRVAREVAPPSAPRAEARKAAMLSAKQANRRVEPEQPQVRRFSRNGLIMEKEICLACEIEQTIKLL